MVAITLVKSADITPLGARPGKALGRRHHAEWRINSQGVKALLMYTLPNSPSGCFPGIFRLPGTPSPSDCTQHRITVYCSTFAGVSGEGYGHHQNRDAHLSDRSKFEGGVAHRGSARTPLHRQHGGSADSGLLRAAWYRHRKPWRDRQQWGAFSMIKTVKQACRFNPVIQDYRMSSGIENL